MVDTLLDTTHRKHQSLLSADIGSLIIEPFVPMIPAYKHGPFGTGRNVILIHPHIAHEEIWLA